MSSRIPELGEKSKNLPTILAEYADELETVEENLKIKGKRLETANYEQPGWLSHYDQRKIELYTLVKYYEGEVARVRGKLFTKYTETHSHELSDRAKDKYIDNEQAYLTMRELYLEIKEMFDQYESVVKAFEARGFALRNIVNLRVSSMEETII